MDAAFLTARQLVQRWNGIITTGTLANWRAKRVGPAFTKLRGRVLYPIDQIQQWEKANLKESLNDNQSNEHE